MSDTQTRAEVNAYRTKVLEMEITHLEAQLRDPELKPAHVVYKSRIAEIRDEIVTLKTVKP